MSEPILSRNINFVVGLLVWAAVCAPAQTFETLVDFNSTNGASPLNSQLAQGTDGSLYGVTSSGGICCGTVFKITPQGALTTLHAFAGFDGAYPQGGLVLAKDGSFYGTTVGGGNCPSSSNCGTVFRVTAVGTLTTIYNFCPEINCPDGLQPTGGLIQATDGDFYGVTEFGGADDSCTLGCGSVFRITPAGGLTTVYSFTGGSDGFAPVSRLVQAADGGIYGTSWIGGIDNAGLIFKITSGEGFRIVYSFCRELGCPDGASPGDLIQATDGNFYGTTVSGGNSPDCVYCGTLFKMGPNGDLTTLHVFAGGADGFYPGPSLTQDTNHSFYGTTESDGDSVDCSGNCGTIFRISPSGLLTTVHTFGTYTAGADPWNPLLEATDGNIYGSNYVGGSGGTGTVFRLSVGLAPFVKTAPTFGKVGAAVTILGTDLTGTTMVTFDNVAAEFVIVSATAIRATVPASASTGTVEVVTPGGTLLSDVAFQVLP